MRAAEAARSAAHRQSKTSSTRGGFQRNLLHGWHGARSAAVQPLSGGSGSCVPATRGARSASGPIPALVCVDCTAATVECGGNCRRNAARLFLPRAAPRQRPSLGAKEAPWGLVAQISAHGRVACIWRSCVTERLAQIMAGLSAAFIHAAHSWVAAQLHSSCSSRGVGAVQPVRATIYCWPCRPSQSRFAQQSDWKPSKRRSEELFERVLPLPCSSMEILYQSAPKWLIGSGVSSGNPRQNG